MKRHFTDHPKFPNANQGFGILQSARDGIQSGGLFEIKTVITAAVFDDFLEQAQALLAANYFAPAAVVVGAVLEDGLRKLYARSAIALSEKPKLDSMNAALAKAGCITSSLRRVSALADIRNSAAHGRWDTFEAADVESMLQWTRDFMQRHFS
jgi:hypothetical protein